jgi:YidC/Oxa1 family membrane protein insertase
VFIAVWAAMNQTLAIRKGTLWGLKFGEPINTQVFSGSITAIVLFLLMIAGQLVTMRLSMWLKIRKEKRKNPSYKKPEQTDTEKQMNMMMIFMIAMVVMSGFLLPAALVIYWFLGSVFSIIQTIAFSSDYVNEKLKSFANRKKKAKVIR